jgi:hypothetical protein
MVQCHRSYATSLSAGLATSSAHQTGGVTLRRSQPAPAHNTRTEPRVQVTHASHTRSLATCRDTAIERLLVERVVTYWLAAYLADGDAASVEEYGVTADTTYFAKRQNCALYAKLLAHCPCLLTC